MLYGTLDSQINIGANTYPTIRPTLILDFVKSKTVDSRITFNRNSSASYTDKDGYIKYSANNTPRIDYDPITRECKGLLIEEQRTNLLIYTKNLDNNNWSKIRTYIYPNITICPDGTLSAFKLVEDTTAATSHYVYLPAIPVTSNVYYTMSVYAKAAERGNVSIHFYSTNGAFNSTAAYFNLTNGTITSTDPYITNSSINYVNNGWYRISATSMAIATTGGNIAFDMLYNGSTTGYTGDGISGIYLWGPQLEAGSFPTSYIPSTDTFVSRSSTGTYVASNGYIQTASANTARYSYNPLNLSISPTLLLENSSTNLITYSQQLNNWPLFSNCSIALSGTSPDGNTSGAFLVTEDGTLNPHGPVNSVTLNPNPIGNTYTYSIFAKAGTRTNIFLIPGSAETYSIFDIANGTVLFSGANNYSTIQNYGSGWYRCSTTITKSTNTASMFIYGSVANNSFYTGNSTFYLWGAQVEQSNSVSSYIQTGAAAATMASDISTSATSTRIYDNASITGSNFSPWYNQKQGTFLISNDYLVTTGQLASERIITLSDGTNINTLRPYISNAGTIAWFSTFGGPSYSTNLSSFGVISPNTTQYMAFGYNTDNNLINWSLNGSLYSFTNRIQIPYTMNTLNLGYYNLAVMSGHIKSLIYYPQQLSNTQIQTLTAQ